MNKIIVIPVISSLLLLLLFGSCTQNPVEEEGKALSKTGIVLPESFTYAGKKPEIHGLENLDIVMEWNKRRSALDFNIQDLITDSLILRLETGNEIVLKKASASAYLETVYKDISTQKITINAAIPIHYQDIDHDWVYSWIYREIMFRNGDTENTYLHEDFRIIDSKISQIYQFRRIQVP